MSNQHAITSGWDVGNIPDLSGKRFLITGGTSGLGRATAAELVSHGADVTITARSEEKGKRAIAEIGHAAFIKLDLSDLESVRKACDSISDDFDVVILNAGIMATPMISTIDGFELQMGTNYLGHFAFSGLIRDRIKEKLIVVSSFMHRYGSFGSGSIADIRKVCLGEGSYSPWGAYSASKLALLLFVSHLERFRITNNWGFTPLAAHPGYAATNLQLVGAEMNGNFVQKRAMALGGKLFGQSALQGSLPILYAATSAGLLGASYIGPDGFKELRGHPKLTRAKDIAYDQILAANLWQVSEELTGVNWETTSHA